MRDSKRRRRWPRTTLYAVLCAGLGLAAGLGVVLGSDPLDLTSSNSSQAAGKRQRIPVRNASGDLDRLIDDFVRTMTKDTAYRRPQAGPAARLVDSFRAVRAGKLNRAAALARPLGYSVVRYRDTASGRRLVLLREKRPRRRGWGLYIHSPRSRSRLIVEVAHPGSDIKSERVGAETFRRANASDLFVAGALRDAAPDESADVAHVPNSAFEAVHRATMRAGTTVVQPHGFDSGDRGKQYGEIVVSSGTEPTELVQSLAARLRGAGFDTCLYQSGRCEGLGGITNVQGQSARAVGAAFIHLELARRLRESRALRSRIASIVAAELRPR